MKRGTSLSKEDKAKAQMLANLLNEFLEKDLKKEKLSTPSKTLKYWKTLERNLWQQKMEPPGPFCFINSAHWDDHNDMTGLLKEEVGSANVILWLHSLLKSVRKKFEDSEETYYDEDDDDRTKNDLIDNALVLRTKLRDPLNIDYQTIFVADLLEFMPYLRKCHDNLCGKWFVERSNKEFCCHNCAARYDKRMKRGKGDLQLSYRPRRPNKKKRNL